MNDNLFITIIAVSTISLVGLLFYTIIKMRKNQEKFSEKENEEVDYSSLIEAKEKLI